MVPTRDFFDRYYRPFGVAHQLIIYNLDRYIWNHRSPTVCSLLFLYIVHRYPRILFKRSSERKTAESFYKVYITN